MEKELAAKCSPKGNALEWDNNNNNNI